MKSSKKMIFLTSSFLRQAAVSMCLLSEREGTEEDEERVRKEDGETRWGGRGGKRKEWGRKKR